MLKDAVRMRKVFNISSLLIESRMPEHLSGQNLKAEGFLRCCSYAIAAEQKARVTYDNILRLSDDPDVSDAIKFLRAREIVHFQRFGEGLRLAKERLDQKNVYYLNPGFDSK